MPLLRPSRSPRRLSSDQLAIMPRRFGPLYFEAARSFYRCDSPQSPIHLWFPDRVAETDMILARHLADARAPLLPLEVSAPVAYLLATETAMQFCGRFLGATGMLPCVLLAKRGAISFSQADCRAAAAALVCPCSHSYATLADELQFATKPPDAPNASVTGTCPLTPIALPEIVDDDPVPFEERPLVLTVNSPCVAGEMRSTFLTVPRSPWGRVRVLADRYVSFLRALNRHFRHPNVQALVHFPSDLRAATDGLVQAFQSVMRHSRVGFALDPARCSCNERLSAQGLSCKWYDYDRRAWEMDGEVRRGANAMLPRRSIVQ